MMQDTCKWLLPIIVKCTCQCVLNYPVVCGYKKDISKINK